MKLSVLLPFALAVTASAQTTSAYTDSNLHGSNLWTFSIALPETPTSDFIGLLLGSGMVGKLLVVAWPNGNQLVSSFRKAGHLAGAFSMTPIAKGTYVNSTHYSYTFLCEGCLLTDGTTFATNTTSGLSHSSTLNRHTLQGSYDLQVSAAESSNYAQWAAMAASASASPRIFTA
ncbi:iron reductase domain protein [Cenococcum geophilum]